MTRSEAMHTVQARNLEIDQIILSPEQEKQAIWNMKVLIWHERRNQEYWKELEEQKPKANVSNKILPLREKN